MTEILFVLTVIFVAYVVYVVINEKKPLGKSTTSTVETEEPVVSVEIPSPESVSEPEPPKTTQTKSPKTTQTKPTKTKTASTDKNTTAKKGLKNPQTGEIVTTYSNYIFTKRWIKDALVSEGLLEKVYKNNELNAETEAAIKAAIAKLEKMKKYKA